MRRVYLIDFPNGQQQYRVFMLALLTERNLNAITWSMLLPVIETFSSFFNWILYITFVHNRKLIIKFVNIIFSHN